METQKALVIDDEQIVLDSVSKILREEDYTVDVTLSGREGRDKAIQENYDIVLTDIRMPDIGGMRVLRDVKRAKPSLPVVIITGYATVRSAVQAMKLGAADYLEKPFTPDQLLKACASALRPPRTRRSSTKRRSSRCWRRQHPIPASSPASWRMPPMPWMTMILPVLKNWPS